MREGLGFFGTLAVILARCGWPVALVIGILIMIFALWRMGIAVQVMRIDAFGAPYLKDDIRIKKWMFITVLAGFVAMVAVIKV